MKYLKLFSGWGWAEIIFLMLILVGDNTLNHHDALWITLIISLSSSIPAITDEIEYKYSLPVNHPLQKLSEQGLRANVVRSWLSLFLCLAPILCGPVWIKVLAMIAVLVASYAVVCSHRLYSFTDGDVKYEG